VIPCASTRTDAARATAVNSVLSWVDRVAAAELLIASDLDGTLAEIVSHPVDVLLDARTRAALRRLAGAARTHVAILSGRTAVDLTARIGDIGPAWLSSDHGAVVRDPHGRAHAFGDATTHDAKLQRLRSRADDLARVFHGAHVEVKPRSVALHYREVLAYKHDALCEMFRLSCVAHGAKPLHGRRVIEGRYGEGDKGAALAHILSRLPDGTGLIYVGDDATDEPALAYAHAHPRGLALYVQSSEREPPRANVHGWLAGPSEWLEILEAIAAVRAPPKRQ